MNAEELMKDLVKWVEQVADFQRSRKEQQQQLIVAAKEHELDYVTDVDIASEEMLIGRIKAKYPGHSILTEERGLLNPGSDYLWVIDPIDGTTNFIHGFPLSSISVGVQYKGITQAGIVLAPWLGMTFQAVRGGGAYLNGHRVRVSRTDELRHSLLGTGFPAGDSRPQVNLPYFHKMVSRVSGIRRTGSAALDLCFVAASFLDGYWEFGLNEWDICAGAFLVREAGGKVIQTDVDGQPLLVCGNPGLAERLQVELLEHNGIYSESR